jgi:ABC-type phosphonate transport system ATPase subunit
LVTLGIGGAAGRALALMSTTTEPRLLAAAPGASPDACVLDDPQHPYTQLLVSSVLQP